MDESKLKGYLDVLTELRHNSKGEITLANVNTLIGLVIFGMIIDFIFFTYVWHNTGLMVAGFVILMILLCILIVAKHIWFPAKPSGNDDAKEFRKENKKANQTKPKEQSITSTLGLDNLNVGLGSAEEYNKNLEKAFS